MIIRPASSSSDSERMTSAHVPLLKECDDVRTFSECGWFCALGFKGRERVVYVHANSFEEYDRMMNPEKYRGREYDDYLGYKRRPRGR